MNVSPNMWWFTALNYLILLYRTLETTSRVDIRHKNVMVVYIWIYLQKYVKYFQLSGPRVGFWLLRRTVNWLYLVLY